MKKIILRLLYLTICTFSITVQSQATFTGLKKDYTQSMDSIVFVHKLPGRLFYII